MEAARSSRRGKRGLDQDRGGPHDPCPMPQGARFSTVALRTELIPIAFILSGRAKDDFSRKEIEGRKEARG